MDKLTKLSVSFIIIMRWRFKTLLVTKQSSLPKSFFFKGYTLNVLFIYFGCARSSLLRSGFLQLQRAGTTL